MTQIVHRFKRRGCALTAGADKATEGEAAGIEDAQKRAIPNRDNSAASFGDAPSDKAVFLTVANALGPSGEEAGYSNDAACASPRD